MSCAIIVHGAVGSGKTRACLELAERARTRGIPVGGVLSVRVYQGEELIGYDGLDLASDEAFPLARLRGREDGPDWFVFGSLIYAFSAPGFERANNILMRSAETLSQSSTIFVDEFGRLERAGLGIYPGALRVAEKLRIGGIAVFACRSDMVDAVEALTRGQAQDIFRYEPKDLEAIWGTVLKYVNHAELNG
jgi:nucleoside-triphosphatase THEP1